MTDLVSVVIPSYNHAAYIGFAIDSVLQQTYPHVELIVVDDGSHDGSAKMIAERYGDKVAKLVVQENRGAHAAINRGIAESSGRFVAILNSDDIYAPERLAKMMQAAAREDAQVLFSDLTIIDADGAIAGEHAAVRAYRRNLERRAGMPLRDAVVLGQFTVTTSNYVIRRDAFDAIGKFRPFRMTHDWDFILRAARGCRLARVPESLLSYRIHGTNTINAGHAWLLPTECAFLYAEEMLAQPDFGSPEPWCFFESEMFNPLLLAWMLVEHRRLGMPALMTEIENGTLHLRAAEYFTHVHVPGAARFSLRRLKKIMKWNVKLAGASVLERMARRFGIDNARRR
jgi:glycosyltransferase involved in cell wall biosynthesis